jgi:hypothetical protein
MYRAVKQIFGLEPEILGIYDTYSLAKDKVTQAVILYRNTYGREGSISRCDNSASRYPYRIEIEEFGSRDCFYVELI